MKILNKYNKKINK